MPLKPLSCSLHSTLHGDRCLVSGCMTVVQGKLKAFVCSFLGERGWVWLLDGRERERGVNGDAELFLDTAVALQLLEWPHAAPGTPVTD